MFEWTGSSLKLDLQGLEEGLLGDCAIMSIWEIKPVHLLAKKANGHIAVPHGLSLTACPLCSQYGLFLTSFDFFIFCCILYYSETQCITLYISLRTQAAYYYIPLHYLMLYSSDTQQTTSTLLYYIAFILHDINLDWLIS